MSFTGDIIAISGLAVRVYIAYKDAPDDYRYILKEVTTFQFFIEKVAQHMKNATISIDHSHDGQRVLKGCQSVLQDLYALIEKHKSLASINKGLVLKGVKVGKEDITSLHEQLISKTGLLNSFTRRFVVQSILALSILLMLIFLS